jgi:hypothetical protein
LEQEKMATDVPEKNEEAAPVGDSDWNNRVLCSDGNCIGVIGPDGRCKECGKKYEGDLPAMPEPENQDPPAAEDQPAVADDPPTAAADEPDEAGDAQVDDDWEERILCSDGNCIGVIGPDGKCKECGKPAE